MLKSVFFPLSLPGNLRSLLDLPNFLFAALISAPYLSSPAGPMQYKQVGLIWHKFWLQAADMKHLPSVAQRVGLWFLVFQECGRCAPLPPQKVGWCCVSPSCTVGLGPQRHILAFPNILLLAPVHISRLLEANWFAASILTEWITLVFSPYLFASVMPQINQLFGESTL